MNTVIAIVLFLITLIALYKLYYTVNPDVLNKDGALIQLKRSPQLEIDISELEDPSGVRYFYDGWLIIKEVQSENVSHIIFNRGKDFIVSLKGHVLSIVGVKNKIDIDTSTGTYKENNIAYKIIDIATNLPFQKMVHFCINVDSNKMDIYLNGKIVKSVNGTEKGIDFNTFEKPNSISVGSKYISGGLARFRREPGNIDPPSVWANYMIGAGVSTLDENTSSDYHAKLDITKNNKPRKTIQIF
jgi:hypothetical protein